jgi:hypothetical protein
LVGVVFTQRGVGEEAVVDSSTNAVVIGGVWEDFDLIVDGFDTRNTLEGIVDVTLEDGTGGITLNDDSFAVEAEGYPVEDAVVGEASEAFLDLLGDAHTVFL